MKKPIYYEKHPVTQARHEELMAKGYRVIDARFAPDGWEDPDKPKRKPRKKSDAGE